jgi:MFS family permease
MNATRQLWLLAFFRIARSLSAGLIAITFPYYVLRDLSHSAFLLGLVYATATLATGGLALLIGYLGDTHGRKGMLLFGGVLLPVSALLVFFSGRLSVLFIAAILGGFSATGSRAAGSVGGAIQPVQTAAISDLTSLGNRTFVFSAFTFVSGIFGAAGMLASKLFSLRGNFLAACLISLASVLFILPMQLPRREAPKRQRLQSTKVIRQFSTTAAINGLSQGLVLPFLVPFFVIVYRFPRERMAIYGFIAEVLSSIIILASPWIERRVGFVKGIALTRGVGGALLVLMPLIRNLPLALGIYIVTPALRVAAIPAQQTALTAMISTDETGRALGTNQLARLVGSTGAIGFTGYEFSASYLGVPFYLYAALTAISVGLYFRFFGARPELRPTVSDS